jgi:hypothetical protein
MKIDTPILKRLGPVPFWRGAVKCLDELERIYRRAHEFAEEKLGYDPAGGRNKSKKKTA